MRPAVEYIDASSERGWALQVRAPPIFDFAWHEAVQRDDLAAAVSMSPSSVSRLLRRSLGITLTDYLTARRVSTASRLLAESDRGIAEIAHVSGFANLANFNRQFRQRRGMTPREYRRAFAAPCRDDAQD